MERAVALMGRTESDHQDLEEWCFAIVRDLANVELPEEHQTLSDTIEQQQQEIASLRGRAMRAEAERNFLRVRAENAEDRYADALSRLRVKEEEAAAATTRAEEAERQVEMERTAYRVLEQRAEKAEAAIGAVLRRLRDWLDGKGPCYGYMLSNNPEAQRVQKTVRNVVTRMIDEAEAEKPTTPPPDGENSHSEADDVLRALIRETAGDPQVVRSKFVWRALSELCRRALKEDA